MSKKSDRELGRLARAALTDMFVSLEDMLQAEYKDGWSDGYDEAKEIADEEMKA